MAEYSTTVKDSGKHLTLEDAGELLAAIPKAYKMCSSKAMRDTLKHMRVEAKRAVKDKLDVPSRKIDERERQSAKSRVDAHVGTLSGTIEYRGTKMPLSDYRGVTPRTDRRKHKWTHVKLKPVQGKGKEFLMAHPSIAVRAHQYKGNPSVELKNVFYAKMPNWAGNEKRHEGFFERVETREGKTEVFAQKTRYHAIREVKGGSIEQYIAKPEVNGKVLGEGAEYFGKRLDAMVDLTLSGKRFWVRKGGK